MKFCYIDESGFGEEPYSVMVGVIVDAQRMHVTKRNWDELLFSLSQMVGSPLAELHTRDFYSGNGIWRGIDGQTRSNIITAIFNWLHERQHHLVYSVVDKERFYQRHSSDSYLESVGTLWRFMALHVTLSIQKHFQSEPKNKGNTLLIFDNEDREAKNFITLIRQPPLWTDAYYGKKTKQEQLDQIIDVPYFGDSQHVGLIQVADFVSYFFRRYIELHEGAGSPQYRDEGQKVDAWMNIALSRSIPKSAIYPSRHRCTCADLFYSMAPGCIKK